MEALLSDEAKVVTYVDKKRHQTTYRLDDVTIDPTGVSQERLEKGSNIIMRTIFSHNFSLPSRVESNHHLTFCLLKELVTLKNYYYCLFQ